LGGGNAAIADGTHVSSARIISWVPAHSLRWLWRHRLPPHLDTYIALFTSFISCGVWEAVHILDGLMKNRSTIQPDTLHADTQVKASSLRLCRLLGIKLMPRMRGLSDAGSIAR